jgi:hypothetical protein
MSRGDKSGNPKMKRHRATRMAARLRERGAPRAEANRIATAAMEMTGRQSAAKKSSASRRQPDSIDGRAATRVAAGPRLALNVC